MKDGKITEFVGGFDDYLDTVSVVENKEKRKAPVKAVKIVKASEPAELLKPKASPEELIYEAETGLEKLNKEIESCLSGLEYEKINELYQKKHQLEEHIASLYEEWVD
jgi:hypothetical protein